MTACTCQRHFRCAFHLGILSEPKPADHRDTPSSGWVAGFGSESVVGHVLYAINEQEGNA